jgi:glycosyltransferase involved in cell wall biosynthesis
MGNSQNHISVCVCTFKRAELLTRLLDKLESQVTEGEFTFSVVVADNDIEQSADRVVKEFARPAGLRVSYCMEPRQNIALVRNKALQNADGDLIAFIDDDEVPGEKWLWNLFTAYRSFQADGVLGPVKPYFDHDPPAWVRKGKFFERPDYPTGYKLRWNECRTGNVLFSKKILELVDVPFRPEFRTAGEDMDFFRRMIENGCRFIWCSEAVAFELVPEARCKRSFLLKRALLRGSNFPKHPSGRLINCLKSVVAVPAYTLALPVLALAGQHLFVKYLVKICDHLSRLLAFAGWAVVKERET